MPDKVRLDKVRAEDFAPHIGKPCRATWTGGLTFDLVIESVEEKAHLQRPQDGRAPFSLVLKGALEPSFALGTLDLEAGGTLCLAGVYIARIDPPWGLDRTSAYYQVVFN